MNPLKYAVSIIVYKNDKEFLTVKRPSEDRMGDSWGLPASGFDPKKESPDQAALRTAKEKLNCEVQVIERIPLVMIQKRPDYDLMLIDYICKLKAGEPDVKKAQTQGTVYSDQKWTDDPKTLEDIAEKGSICTQLFLNHLGILSLDKLKTSL